MTIKDRQINVAIGRTINLGNFSSLKVTAGIGGCVEDDADLATEYKALWNTANIEINRAISAFDKEKK